MMRNIDFLMDNEPWTAYRTMVDLLGKDEEDSYVQAARVKMLEHTLVRGLVNELGGWPGNVISSHKSAKQHYHKLSFVADLGLNVKDDGIQKILSKILDHQSQEGPFQLPINIPDHFGGTGETKWGWALCDAPIIVYSLVKMGLGDDPRVKKAVTHLLGFVRDSGWPCGVSKELGKFRGPGRKSDPCPYVNLIMLKLLSLYDEHRNGTQAMSGIECLLDLWDMSKEKHPYMFYMGNDFKKIKAPHIWYDIVHVADVLSRYEVASNDPRFRDMIKVLNSKADINGLFTPESVWTPWKEWDFGQKKEPSSWLTFLIYRINANAGEIKFTK